MSNSDPRNPKNLPPDDFAKTTPGIQIPRESLPASNEDAPADDWGKTNYNFSPKQTPSAPAADDWGKTATNINVPRYSPSPPPEDDFGKTYSGNQSPKEADWGATQTNINIPRESFGREDYGARREPEQNATMPYFRLPENERAKYQNLPPATASADSSAVNQKQEKKRGIPFWAWISGGLLAMFFFALSIIALVYIFFIPKTSFELTVTNVPAGSDIFVDGQRWNLTSADGSYKLPGLKAGKEKTIEIKSPGYTCKPQQITGENDKPMKIDAPCFPIAVAAPPPVNDCQNIKKGDFAKAAKCANDALDNLKEPISVEDLLRAMNLYIINFPSGKYDIVKPEDKAFLQKAAGYIQKLPPSVVIEVGGHTDNVGNKASNQALSDNRAKAVKTALVTVGVKDAALLTKGYGDAKPKAANDTEDGKFQNRRIEYSVASK